MNKWIKNLNVSIRFRADNSADRPQFFVVLLNRLIQKAFRLLKLTFNISKTA